MRRCKCDRCKIGEPFTEDQCALCWLYHNNPRYKKHWDSHKTNIVLGPCANLGKATGERRECKTCTGTVQIKLMACTVYEQCTTVKKLEGLVCCRGCSSYQKMEE